eukprot:71895-Rhodomonas_salina.2
MVMMSKSLRTSQRWQQWQCGRRRGRGACGWGGPASRSGGSMPRTACAAGASPCRWRRCCA